LVAVAGFLPGRAKDLSALSRTNHMSALSGHNEEAVVRKVTARLERIDQ